MSLRRSLVLVLLLVGAGLTTSTIGPSPSVARPEPDPARGLVYEGLRPARPGSPCAHGFEIRVSNGPPLCSHGPDPVAPGVDIRVLDPTRTVMGTPESSTALAASSAVTCVGNGTDGTRIQALYVHGPTAPALSSSTLTSIRSWAAAADDVFSNSAAETGGNRRLRWVTDASCNLNVLDVKLPSGSALSGMNTTIDALVSLGFNRADRKYVMWADNNTYCGIATLYHDDRPGQDNLNNGAGASYARIDRSCWGQAYSVEAHEIMHMLGAVQRSAPHSTANAHCTDEYDRMCYEDGSGAAMTYPCDAFAGENRFDCRHDDYFHTSPASDSYLATHWNAANSAWLYDPGGSQPPPPPPPPSGETVTDTLTGTTRAGRNTKRSITVGAGTTTVKLTLGRAQSVTLKLKNAAGKTVAKQSGTTPLQLTKDLAAGTYTVTFATTTATSYTLEVTHPPAT